LGTVKPWTQQRLAATPIGMSSLLQVDRSGEVDLELPPTQHAVKEFDYCRHEIHLTAATAANTRVRSGSRADVGAISKCGHSVAGLRDV
jgi:hypothetical protein